MAAWFLFLGYALIRLLVEPFASVAGAVAIVTAALLPAFIWTGGRVPGLPIVPIHTTAFLWTHALPVIAGSLEVGAYDADEIMFASLCVVIYCVLATIAWILIATRPVKARAVYYVLANDWGFTFFIVAIGIGGLLIAAMVNGWIYFAVDPGVFGLLRSSILAFASIGMFLLALRMARGEMRLAQRVAFLTVAAFFLVAQITTLYLIGAMVSLASAAIGYTIGRGRVPWAAMAAALLFFGFLHGGKGDMRDDYWANDAPTLTLAEVPAFFADWIAAGTRDLTTSAGETGSSPIYDRLDLMHLLLLVQRRSPDAVPYLGGETYRFIPRLLIPRIFDPDKPPSNLGTSMLSVRYRIQSDEDTESTSVAWGLTNEAYANFGLAGVAGLGILIGLLFGFFGRLTAGAPVMSIESMAGVTVAALAIQSEFTMGVFVTVLFQSLVVLLLLVPFLDKRRAGEWG